MTGRDILRTCWAGSAIRSSAGVRPPPRPDARITEGMGLGLFIAKTLLERSGAELSFANGSDSFHGNSALQERIGA